jgi:DNA-binding NarL/FixJ family response regulator
MRPQIRSVVLIQKSDEPLAIEAFRAGAKGVFPRSQADIDILAKCVDRVHAGQIWASSVELEQLIESCRSPAPLTLTNVNGVNLLSKQEARIVRLVAQGRTNREIAEQLELSEHTVKNYLFKIFDKLGISNRVELVLYAVSQEDQSDAASRLNTPTSKQAS